MKRANYLMEQIIEPENLRLAYWKASKGKRHKHQVRMYANELDSHLCKLRSDLITGEIEVGKYHIFTIFEPKERKICASAFDEQVLHHALMNVCHDHFEKAQIFDSYASRIGKGTHAAIRRAQEFSRSNKYYLKLDVKQFFASIHHEVVKYQLTRLFKESSLRAILGKITDSYNDSDERGLPIGNLTSQYFANHYLSGLDHFVKEILKVKHYVRYMDDMVLWNDDKGKLKAAHTYITEFVEDKLLCTLKPAQLNTIRLGLPFLGFRIFPHHVRLTQSSKKRFIKKFKKLDTQYHSGEWDEEKCQRKILPLLAFIQIADTKAFLHTLKI